MYSALELKSILEGGNGGVPISVVSQKFGFLSVVSTIMALSVIYGKVLFLKVQIHGHMSIDHNYTDGHNIPVFLKQIDTINPIIHAKYSSSDRRFQPFY